jgi:putative hemolysin
MIPTHVAGAPFKIDEFVDNPLVKRFLSLMDGPLATILGTGTLSKTYQAVHSDNDSAENFSGKVLDALNIRYSCDFRKIGNIPETGPVVMVSNHPFGVAEGLVLTLLLKSVRPDVKIMANYMLAGFEEFKDVIIPVDPLGRSNSVRDNVKALRDSMEWVRDGHALVIFPSGTVSHWSSSDKCVTDPDWSPSVGRLIQKTGAPVVPIYFKGQNGLAFQLAGMVSPKIRSLLIPRCLLDKRGKTVSFNVGSAIAAKRLEALSSGEEVVRYLRFRTYLLGGDNKSKPKAAIKANALISPMNRDRLQMEINSLPSEQLLLRSKQFSVFHAGANQIPTTLKEIGRLREISFRACGEGTGEAIDLDEFDRYYTHLFVWDTKEREILGAYRLCAMQEVIRRRGLEGVYSNQFFRYKEELFDRIPAALEMGRSFVQPRYQRLPSALFMLWKGIGHYVAKHPQYRMLMGPVSTSNDFSPVSRQLLVKYLKMQTFDDELASLVKAATPFKFKRLKGAHTDDVMPLVGSLDEVSRCIAEVDPDCDHAPILLKHYLKLGGRILGFNVDHDFCDVLDALIMVDFAKTDPKYLKKYMGRENALRYLYHHSVGAGAAVDA